MKLTSLLPLLPPYKGDNEFIVDRQDSDDIVDQVISAHRICAKDYNTIARKFLNDDLYEQLFYDCKDQLKYSAESKKVQTTRSPAGIITLAPTMGVDCKHYAGFIAGVIDAVSRLRGVPVKWAYRFASYDSDPAPQHVFVVVHDGPDEIWIDPTPIINKLTGRRTERYYNDRLTVPTHFFDIKPKKMLSHLSGIDMRQQVGSTYIVDDGCGVGCVNMNGADVDPIVQAAGESYGVDVQKAADTLLSFLPEGDIKAFLEDFLSNPNQAIKDLINGRKYTIGDYQVAEKFMRNINGLVQVQNWRQVPDGNVPLGWAFFTAALGVRVRTIEDIATLYNAAGDGGGAQNYLTRNPTQNHDISLAAAERARAILTGMSSSIDQQNAQWPIGGFATIPYIYPIPGVVQDTANFTGKHPVTGENFVNGYPANWLDVQFTNQLKTQVLRPAITDTETPINQNPLPVGPSGTPVTVTPKPEAKQAGFGTVIGLGLLGLAVGVGIHGFSKPKKGKRGAMNGMGKNGRVALAVAGGAVTVGAGYLIYRNVSVAQKRKQLIDWATAATDMPSSKDFVIGVFRRLTDDEVRVMYDFVFKHIIPLVPIDATQIEFRARLQAIEDKYGIFN
jgi:hypothetical protein